MSHIETLDIIKRHLDAIDSSESIQDIDRAISEFMRDYGLRYMCGISKGHSHNSPWRSPIYGIRPANYEDTYFSEKLYECDPVCKKIERSTSPFLWIMDDWRNSGVPKTKNWIDLNCDIGISFGIAVPVHSDVSVTNMSVIPDRPEKYFTCESRRLLPFIQLFAMALASKINAINKENIAVNSVSTKLSVREIECLSWASEGKTAWEISVILGISESTVIFHIENSKKKLSSTNLPHAVLIASRGNII